MLPSAEILQRKSLSPINRFDDKTVQQTIFSNNQKSNESIDDIKRRYLPQKNSITVSHRIRITVSDRQVNCYIRGQAHVQVCIFFY
jgi:hypothetical protein